MDSDGIQITIPDFDEDDFSNTPLFGRSQGPGLFGSATSGSDSPTILTPVATERPERSYFHSRNDSAASEDSSHSIPHTSRKLKTPFAHSAQSSVATTSSSPFSKKPSFASLRNAFKKSNDAAPPVPILDQQAYPVLKNPFNRSTSSLAQHASRPSMHASPPHVRPPTPASGDAKMRRTPSRSKGHGYGRSQHSYSGSIFHFSDGGSDHGHGFSLMTPPPVPPVPQGFGHHFPMGESDSIPEIGEQVTIEPRTPADFALHAIFIRFAACAESLIADFVSQPYDREPQLDSFMGHGVDSKLDDLLQSLGKIAQKHAKSVVESVIRWRKSQMDSSGSDYPRSHFASPKGTRTIDPSTILAERKALASMYIMCRALTTATKGISNDSLGEAVGNKLEEMTFEQFRSPNIKALTQTGNPRAMADLWALLLGNLADIRFESVTDRFLAELGPVAAGQVPKDSDYKYEFLVKGLRHIPIKAIRVWPPERFEEGAEFLESLSKSFGNAHGNRLKSVFAETLVHMLHPIAKAITISYSSFGEYTAQAEVNHPEWAKAIELIYPKAKDMMSKPRYWHVAYPLAVTSLCVAPHEFFLKHWMSCFEAGLGKMKERPYRMTVLNGMMRLIWTYLYRCHESPSTACLKLESLMKHFFPSNRLTIIPQEDRLEPFIYMVHYILSRHVDFGSELCLELLQARNISSGSGGSVSLGPERIAIASQAILLSLHLVEREEPVPSWPSNLEFGSIPPSSDYPMSADALSSPIPKQGLQDLLEQCSSCISTIAKTCYQAIGKMSIFDEQWSSSRLGPTYEEAHSHIIRHHPEGTFAYPQGLHSQIHLLQTCYRSWPRCLDPSLPVETAFDMLLRGVVHVEPSLGEAATQAIYRFITDHSRLHIILTRFCDTLFDPQHMAKEGTNVRMMTDCVRVLEIWIRVVDKWAEDIIQQSPESRDLESIVAMINEIEAGSLFLLSNYKPVIVGVGVKAFRILGTLLGHLGMAGSAENPLDRESFRMTNALLGRISPSTYLHPAEDLMTSDEIAKLMQWKNHLKLDVALRIAESEHRLDRGLWLHVFPAFIQACLEYQPGVFSIFREQLKTAALRYHPLIMQLSGVQARVPSTQLQRSGSFGEKEMKLLADSTSFVIQWHMWMKLLCTITQVPDARPIGNPRDHSRARSEANVERDTLNNSRDLFKYLGQFLDSDHSIFRDAAVSSISSLPAHGYSFLLEDLTNLAARQFFDDPRSKSMSVPSNRIRRQERFHTAVARIYFLTARHLQEQRSSGKQAALTHVLKYIRSMQASLSAPENRDIFSLQPLRRYFCGTLERLFDGLATLNDSDRFIPSGMHLALYRMCEEWCQLGKQSETVKKRLVVMQSAAANYNQDPVGQAEVIRTFQTETRALSNAAIGAMAALVRKAYFPPEVTASPVDRAALENVKPLEPGPTLDRIIAILQAFNENLQAYGKKALRSLLSHSPHDSAFADEVLRRAFVTTRDMDTSNARFFDVVADVICNGDHGFKFSQVVCLGLSNLCHPLAEIRYRAFNMLETIHEQTAGIISMVQYEAAVGSSSPSTYLNAHRLISDVLSGEHPDHALDVLAQFAGWIPQVFDGGHDRGTLVLLQSLEFWVPSIDLMSEDKTSLSREGRSAIYHLVALTLKYAETHAEQIFVLWTRLVDAPYQSNGHAIIRFLLEQSQKVGSAIFVACAAKIVACLSQSVVGRQLFEELCSVIEPARMLPSIEHKLVHPDAEDIEMWSDLDILFSEQPRLSLGTAQYSMLFLAETTMERYWDFKEQLPILLHALFMHLDHRQAFVRERSRHMLFQILRSCISGYDELLERGRYPSRPELKNIISTLQEECDAKLWKEDDPKERAEPLMRWLCGDILVLLEPLVPKLCETWGSLALAWGTACSIRPIAFRSLQFFRALQPTFRRNDLGILLGRLSITIADEDPAINNFNVELILTLKTMATSGDVDTTLPQIFWTAVAILSTTVEQEFQSALELLDTILVKLDLDDHQVADFLLSHQPPDWRGMATLQSSLLTGLRSSSTLGPTFKLLQRLTKVQNAQLIDPTEGRVRDLYTLSLPWCLRAMYTEQYDETLQGFALDIARLAEEEERPSLTRIMTSFAKRRFRTKEDFLRQSVAGLREHYGAEHWTEVMTLLMGLVLNKERWLRVHTMQILKVLFQQRETRTPVDLLGSELLMPLLRLLETDLATEALDVLEEPMQISGGPSARHVLRMSMHHHLAADAKEVESVAEVFGIAQESGWCVPHTTVLREISRANVWAVFDTCKVPSRPSRIDFQPEDVFPLSQDSPDNLGELVQNLHELSSFFQEKRSSDALPSKQLEARVAAILAKSTDAVDTPQTPLADIFDLGSISTYDESDGSDPSDTESELFEFDSPQVAQYSASATTNGFYAH
ncbi:hypothetical protein K474DRAFT_1622759 [Panus rudis PR-1116 ss-1]|nr:hypothetical protein K474DRAFT_1622759 [Panus rudis PR-1116 ss-1]